MQETEYVEGKEKGAFQIHYKDGSDYDQIKQLVLKNETLTSGNVYLQGPQNQVRQFLKNNIYIKPNCMTDRNLTLTLKVMYS